MAKMWAKQKRWDKVFRHYHRDLREFHDGNCPLCEWEFFEQNRLRVCANAQCHLYGYLYRRDDDGMLRVVFRRNRWERVYNRSKVGLTLDPREGRYCPEIEDDIRGGKRAAPAADEPSRSYAGHL